MTIIRLRGPKREEYGLRAVTKYLDEVLERDFPQTLFLSKVSQDTPTTELIQTAIYFSRKPDVSYSNQRLVLTFDECLRVDSFQVGYARPYHVTKFSNTSQESSVVIVSDESKEDSPGNFNLRTSNKNVDIEQRLREMHTRAREDPHVDEVEHESLNHTFYVSSIKGGYICSLGSPESLMRKFPRLANISPYSPEYEQLAQKTL